jgi:hypothetical protein
MPEPRSWASLSPTHLPLGGSLPGLPAWSDPPFFERMRATD